MFGNRIYSDIANRYYGQLNKEKDLTGRNINTYKQAMGNAQTPYDPRSYANQTPFSVADVSNIRTQSGLDRDFGYMRNQLETLGRSGADLDTAAQGYGLGLDTSLMNFKGGLERETLAHDATMDAVGKLSNAAFQAGGNMYTSKKGFSGTPLAAGLKKGGKIFDSMKKGWG